MQNLSVDALGFGSVDHFSLHQLRTDLHGKAAWHGRTIYSDWQSKGEPASVGGGLAADYGGQVDDSI